jgi:hypothetical protein
VSGKQTLNHTWLIFELSYGDHTTVDLGLLAEQVVTSRCCSNLALILSSQQVFCRDRRPCDVICVEVPRGLSDVQEWSALRVAECMDRREVVECLATY